MAINEKTLNSLFEGIDFPAPLKKIILMSLEDGVLTDRERELIKKKALAEGMDEVEFEFYFDKIEERFKEIYRSENSPAKIMHEAFDYMESIAKGGQGYFPTEELERMLAFLPGVGGSASGDDSDDGKGLSFDKVLGKINGAVMITGAVASALNLFIKEPSNLNNLKAEVIRNVKIPADIELVVEFLEYAELSVTEEKQKDKAAGILTNVSNFVAGSAIDLIPIWQQKKKFVIDKALKDFEGDSDALKRLAKFKTSPTEKLKKLIATTAGLPVKMSSLFMKVGIPESIEDLLDLMNFVRQMAQSSDPRAPEFREYLLQLQEEGIRKFPDKLAEISSHSIHVSPLQKLKENLQKGNSRLVLAETKIPGDEKEFFDMIRFVEAQARGNTPEAMEFKHFLGRMYEYGLSTFPNSQMELSAYRPHSLEILKYQLASVAKTEEIGGLAGVLKEIAVGSSNQYKDAVESVLRKFPVPTNFDDLIEVIAYVKNIAEGDGVYDTNVPFMEFQNRLFSEAMRIFPEMSEQIFPYRVSVVEKFNLYKRTHSLQDAVTSFKVPAVEEDFFELISFAKSKAKIDPNYKDYYKQLQKRLYIEGKEMPNINQDKLKQYKVKTFGIF